MRATLPAAVVCTALLSWFPAACSPKGGEPSPPLPSLSPDAAPSASAAAPPEPALSAVPSSPDLPEDPAPAPPEETPRRLLSTTEPRRAMLARLEDEPALRPHADLLRAHFGGAVPSPLELQSTTSGGDHRAFLALGGPKERRPFLLVLDAEGRLLWTKERPLAGIAPGVTEIVLLPGPDGQVVISWFDRPTQLVALRTWDASGGILADYQLFPIESGDALSGLYWPGQGFLVVAAQARGAARAQLLDERGRRAWGHGGRGLPWVSRAGAPVALALDTDSSVMLFQLGEPPKPAPPVGPGHVLATRFDPDGAALWERPTDLGQVAPPEGGRAPARIAATRAAEGIVRVAIPAGASRRTLEVSSVGVVSAPRAR